MCEDRSRKRGSFRDAESTTSDIILRFKMPYIRHLSRTVTERLDPVYMLHVCLKLLPHDSREENAFCVSKLVYLLKWPLNIFSLMDLNKCFKYILVFTVSPAHSIFFSHRADRGDSVTGPHKPKAG